MTDVETKDNSCGVESKQKNEDDPYAYLERGDFTSEKFKIEVRGLPKYYGIGEFKKLLNEKLGLQTCKVKPPRKSSGWLYVCFRNEENRQKAIDVLNGILWKNSKLTAQIAKPAPDPFVKRKLEEVSKNKRFKGGIYDPNISVSERVKLTTTPLWKMPYPSQLEFKQKEMRSILNKIIKEIQKENKVFAEWINEQKDTSNDFPCEMKPILHAEQTKGYRNKCEFTIGRNSEENKIIIGFRLSSYAAGSTAVGPIDELCHVPESMKLAVKVLEEFVQNSGLDPFDPVDHKGYWRQVTVRSSRLNHLMLIVAIHPQDLDANKLKELQLQLKEFFETGKGSTVLVTSLYFQTIDKKSIGGDCDEDTLYHLSGTEYIEEILMDMKFRISPQAFFQVNTLGAEVLYKAAINMAQPTEDTAVLDVCCGTGTIGLCFSKYCGEVFGMEIIPNAIKDAKQNAMQNNVTNSEFFVGKAEDILSPVIHRATKPHIIAVVDPPRAGLHHRALLTLRKAKKLMRLVYVSCDPKAAMKNLIDLGRSSSKLYSGDPLVPVKAVAVDMFPHTKHCELILCLERLSEVMKLRKCTS